MLKERSKSNMSQAEKIRLMRNATILRTGDFFQPTKSGGKVVKATKAQMIQAARILRRDGAKNDAINRKIREFRAKAKGLTPAYFAEQAALRKRLGIPKRKGEPRKKGLTGLVYLGAV